MSATATHPNLFIDFERDANASVGVLWDHFVTAVAMYVYTNEGEFAVSVADVADVFNTTPDLVREAVDEHPWLIRTEDDDPAKDLIDSDGSDE